MADASKSEKATPQRRKKARKKAKLRALANFPVRSRGAVRLPWWHGRFPMWGGQWRGLLRNTLELSFREPTRANGPVLFWAAGGVLRWIVPVAATAWVLSLAAGLAQGGLVFAPEALALKPERMSPAEKLKQMFSLAGLSGILKSLLPFARLSGSASPP